MNERHPYEKHLAEKLQNLPPPGEVNQSWEKMRILLDEEMPRGGGLPGRRHWWIFGVAVGILFLATWLSGGSFFDKESPATVAQGNTKNSPAGSTAPNGSPPAAQANGKDQMLANNTEPGRGPSAKQPVKGDNSTAHNRGEPAGDLAAQDISVSGSIDPANAKGTTPGVKPPAGIAYKPTNRSTAEKHSNNNSEPNADDAIITLKNARRKDTYHNDRLNGSPLRDRVQPVLDQPEIGSSVVQAPEDYPTNHRPVLDPATTIEKDYARKKAKLPLAPEPTPADRRKSFKTQRMGTFALGFTLPLAFPLGDQRAMGYNAWAGHNTVSDYLPSPHLQYHITNKTFLQTEAQLISPQFISPTMLSYTTRQMGNYTVSNSIYAQKLYYVNIPVSVHHSPFPGFYMGTGIQFSSMISGVAMNEERKMSPGGGSSLLSETFSRFRNDTLSRKLNNNEFRVLLDANYYFNRFTVGLRYNQALSNYISFRLTPGMPYSFEKNRALQFYLRYNLWEEKKRGASPKSMLSLK